MTTTVDSRQRELLEAWHETASTSDSGQEFDFTDQRHTALLQKRVDAFIANPNESTFEAFWSPEAFRGAVMGGPSLVRKSWESVEEFAAFVKSIRDAEEYDPSWEENFITGSMVWELYGRLHPEREPILSGDACQGLRTFGHNTIRSFEDGRKPMDEFREEYEAVVGHATAGTDHEVPLWDEIEMFLHLVHVTDEDIALERLATGD